MTLEPGWLARQFKQVNEDVIAWPEWMRREAGFAAEGAEMTEETKREIEAAVAFKPDDCDCITCRFARALLELAAEREQDQKAIAVIDRICGDDFCEELDMWDANSVLTGDLKTAHGKLSEIYKAAHSMNRSNTCFGVHDDWRKGVIDAAIEKGKQ